MKEPGLPLLLDGTDGLEPPAGVVLLLDGLFGLPVGEVEFPEDAPPPDSSVGDSVVVGFPDGLTLDEACVEPTGPLPTVEVPLPACPFSVGADDAEFAGKSLPAGPDKGPIGDVFPTEVPPLEGARGRVEFEYGGDGFELLPAGMFDPWGKFGVPLVEDEVLLNGRTGCELPGGGAEPLDGPFEEEIKGIGVIPGPPGIPVDP